jgi:hypothetical protein
MAEHEFGGPWTELKLDAVCYYLECYTKALTAKRFDLWYVDIFAGTGERTSEKLTGGLLESQPMKWVTETLPGSAKRAMNIRPAFKHFILNERDSEHQKALHAIADANPSLDIEIIGDDANEAVQGIFYSTCLATWGIRRSTRRGFLGPICFAGGLGYSRTPSQNRVRRRVVPLSAARCDPSARE